MNKKILEISGRELRRITLAVTNFIIITTRTPEEERELDRETRK